jgi:drug/metabolite transporter (DMT)-like permease
VAATYLLTILAVVFWGANFPLAGLVVHDMHPLAGALGRFILAALAMIPIALIRREAVPVIGGFRTLGVLGLAAGLFNILFFNAMSLTSPVTGSLIMATNPLVTALLAAMVLGERPNSRQMMAVPVAFAGVAAVVLGAGGRVTLSPGDGLMLGADLVWAVYNVLVRRLMPVGNASGNTAVLMIWAAITLAAAVVVGGVPVTMPGPAAGASLLVMALAGTVFAYLFYNAGLVRLGAGRGALFLNLVPVAAMVISAVLGTPPTMLQVAGGMVVIGAVFFATMPLRMRVPA